MRTRFWSAILNGRNQSEDLSVDGRLILDWILHTYGGKVLIGFIWLRIWPSGGLL
jgi:hypothetical protein